MDDERFRELLAHLRLSWKGYRKVRKGVMKRIRRHMRRIECPDTAAYLKELDRNNEARQECDLLMTVSISRFFRDRRLWDVLEGEILPEIIGEQGPVTRAWSAGCACGEEAYSLRIVWESMASNMEDRPVLDLIATDINPACLERAKAGVFSRSSLKDVPEEFRSRCFDIRPEGGDYRIKRNFAAGISWRVGHLLDEPPGETFHLIFLRNNLLTYYADERKICALEKVVQSLLKGGFLIVGSHERVPSNFQGLKPHGSLDYVLRRT